MGVFFLNKYFIFINIVMIYIDKGEENSFVLTLTESTTIADPIYLFVFQSDYDIEADPIYWIGTDTSQYKQRYNLFTLNEGVDVTFIKGQYSYKVYESLEVPENETGLTLIEEGRMVVNGEETNSIYD